MAALLERESVLRSLLSHVERASARHGRLVLLYGEAGIGKTSVVRSLAERIGPDARVLVGSCDPLTTPRPLGPLVDIAPRLGPAVARSMDGAANGAAPPNTVFAALLDELDRSSRPTVVVFEDVHWADSGTFDLLRYLGRRISATPATLIATYRDDEVGPAHPFSVVLGDLAHTASTHREGLDRLSPHAVRALASAAAPAATHRADADELYRVTGGNPFFVTELLAAGAAGTPASIRDAVLGRVARLSPESRRVVDVVAVLGSPAPAQVLHAVLGDGYGLAVESAVQSGVLVAAGLAVSFRHELARQAVLAAVADIRRFELSGRALAAMRGPDVSPDELPRLAALAEDAGDKPAVREFALRAARRATSLGAHREAAAQYSRALRHAGAHRGHRRAELLEGQAYSLYLIDQIPAAEAAWREAAGLRREEGDRLREGDDVRWASYMLWLLGRNDEALAEGLRAVDLLAAAGPSLPLARAYANLAEQHCFACDLDEAVTAAQRAVELGGTLGNVEVAVRARFHAGLVRVLCHDDGWDEVEQAWQAAVDHDLPEQAGMFGPVATGVAAVHRHFPRSERYAERARAYCRDYDMDMFLRFLASSHALGLVHQCRWDDAAAEAEEVLAAPLGAPLSRIFALVALALVRARRGEPGAHTLLAEAVTYGHPTDFVRLAPVWEAMAEVAWLDGDDTAAAGIARRGLAAARDGREPWTAGFLARWVDIAGGKREDGDDWASAAQRWTEIGSPYDAALARLGGDVDAMTDALETFSKLGARPAATRARAKLKAAGFRLGVRGPRGATRTNRHGLTAREQDVIGLLREGLTGPQIARRLHISPKTVARHTEAIFTKLGAHTRAEALRRYEA